MYPDSLISEIESAAYAAWPAAECVEHDGWQLRYAHGFSRRGNSVYPAEPSTVDRGLKLEWCSAWYAERGLDLVVRQNPATEAGLDEWVGNRGFTREGLTHVMVADIQAVEAEYEILETAPPEWWAAQIGLWGIRVDQIDAWRGIIERIEAPVGFGLVKRGTEAVAAGLAVAEGPWLGVFEVIVAENRRRESMGRGLTHSLLAWGAARGARRSFLQVVAENTPAIATYQTLGFEFAYPYWYRRAPSQ